MSDNKPEEQQRDKKLARLREALIVGEKSGEPKPFDFDRFIESKKQQKH